MRFCVADKDHLARAAQIKTDEAHMLQLASKLLEKRPNLVKHMKIVNIELQFDKKKLIVYADMKRWIMFNDLVKVS